MDRMRFLKQLNVTYSYIILPFLVVIVFHNVLLQYFTFLFIYQIFCNYYKIFNNILSKYII